MVDNVLDGRFYGIRRGCGRVDGLLATHGMCRPKLFRPLETQLFEKGRIADFLTVVP